MQLPRWIVRRKWTALTLGVVFVWSIIISVGFLVFSGSSASIPAAPYTDLLRRPDSLPVIVLATPTPSPSLAPTVTPASSPTSTPQPTQEPSSIVAEAVSPPEMYQPLPQPTPQPVPQSTSAQEITPTPISTATPKPTPVPTPTPAPRSPYWVLCLGSCVFLTPNIKCFSYDIAFSSFKKICASPWSSLPLLCDFRLPATCVPPPPSWIVYCDGVPIPAQITCDHSLDNSFHCGGNSEFGTSCFPLQNACSPPEQLPTYSIITCSRTDLGTEVTCIKTSADYGPMLDCDSPTIGSFTCKWLPDNVFTCS